MNNTQKLDDIRRRLKRMGIQLTVIQRLAYAPFFHFRGPYEIVMLPRERAVLYGSRRKWIQEFTGEARDLSRGEKTAIVTSTSSEHAEPRLQANFQSNPHLPAADPLRWDLITATRLEHVMAQKVQTIFIDDIDGGDADGTVRFGIDGTEYEIDLSAAHSDELRKALGIYVQHGRKVAGAARRSPRDAGRRSPNDVDTARVREWAKEQGLEIKDRGRVPADIIEEYHAAIGQ